MQSTINLPVRNDADKSNYSVIESPKDTQLPSIKGDPGNASPIELEHLLLASSNLFSREFDEDINELAEFSAGEMLNAASTLKPAYIFIRTRIQDYWVSGRDFNVLCRVVFACMLLIFPRDGYSSTHEWINLESSQITLAGPGPHKIRAQIEMLFDRIAETIKIISKNPSPESDDKINQTVFDCINQCMSILEKNQKKYGINIPSHIPKSRKYMNRLPIDCVEALPEKCEVQPKTENNDLGAALEEIKTIHKTCVAPAEKTNVDSGQQQIISERRRVASLLFSALVDIMLPASQ